MRRTTPEEQQRLRMTHCEEDVKDHSGRTKAPEEDAKEDVKEEENEEEAEEVLSVKDEVISVKEEEAEEVLSVKEEEEEEISVKEEGGRSSSVVERRMAKFLRYDAFVDNLLDKEDWIQLDDSVLLCRLRVSWQDVVEVVRTSIKRGQPRFEMTISGRCTWLRATRCSFYRQRSLERAGLT